MGTAARIASADGLFEYGSTIERYPGQWWSPLKGINCMIKLTARNAFGFRNTNNQRLRTHTASPPAELADTSASLNFEDPL
ncbi:hypothetical protein [Streptomyces caniscabiei]|uniref:hypothetical protein n=1 Tax=Streptomyces caniscabiei TaxID=2746961 RepID=UPI0038F5EAC0